MPLVGVPSFVQFSQRKDLRAFFVTVRRPDERERAAAAPATATCDSSGSSDCETVVPCIVEQPTNAFKDAAGKGNPWVGRLIDQAWSKR